MVGREGANKEHNSVLYRFGITVYAIRIYIFIMAANLVVVYREISPCPCGLVDAAIVFCVGIWCATPRARDV